MAIDNMNARFAPVSRAANTPEMLAAIAEGRAAKSAVGGLANNPATIQALREQQTPYSKMQGKGHAATAASGLEVLGRSMLRNKGEQGIAGMQAQADALRGKQAAGELAAAQQQEAVRQEERTWDREDATLTNTQRVQAAEVQQGLVQARQKIEDDRYASEQGQLTTAPVEYTNADGEKKMLSRRKDGKWADENRGVVESIEGWSEVPKATITSDGSGYKDAAANKEARTAINALGQANTVVGNYNKLSPETKKKMNSNEYNIKNTLSRATGESINQIIKNNRDFTPAEKQYLTSLAQMSAVERHAMFGGALTTYEGMSSGDFISFVYNMKPEEQQQRIKNSVSANKDKLKVGDEIHGAGRTQYQDAYGRMGYGNLDFKENEAEPGSDAAVGGDAAVQSEIEALRAEIAAEEAALAGGQL